MPITTTGVIRKLMADIFLDMANRLKTDYVASDGTRTSSPFGSSTVLDSPDDFAGDTLVQMSSTVAASQHELWEATEYFYNQLDYQTASGEYLKRLHAIPLGITPAAGQSDEMIRSQIREVVQQGIVHNDPATIALRNDSVSCASLIRSTAANPIEDMPVPSAMLVYRGTIDPNTLAQQIWDNADAGQYDYVGDGQGTVSQEFGGQFCMSLQPACRIFIGLKVKGFFENVGCDNGDFALIQTTINDRLKAFYDTCEFGTRLTESKVRLAIGAIDNFTITEITFARRAKVLTSAGCEEADDVPEFLIDGVLTKFGSSKVCGYCQGELWCSSTLPCLELRPWEFPDFDVSLIEVANDLSRDDCVDGSQIVAGS